jgi:hypothetical protein
VRLAIALLCIVGGCVRAELLECGDKLCSLSQACVVDRCVDPALVCTQAGAECDALGAPGRCTDGVCELAACGDGFVDFTLREDCDNSIPDTQCVDVGFDLGRPGCTACQADLLDGCISFGWKLAVNSPAEKLWTDGETFAYWRFEPSSLEVHGPGVDLSVPFASIADIRGGGGRIVVDGYAGSTGDPDTLDIVNGQAVALSPPPGTSVDAIEAFDVTEDGTLHVTAGCKLHSKAVGGEWQDGPAVPASACSMIEVGSGRTFVVDTSGGVWMLQNGAFVRRFIFAGAIHQMVYGNATGVDALWLATSRGLSFAEDGDTAPKSVFDRAPLTTLALAAGLVYGAVDGEGDDTTLVRWDGAAVGRLQTPSNRAITSDGERVFAYRGPIYEFSGVDFSKRDGIPQLALQEQPVAVIEPPDAKSLLVVTTYGVHVPDDTGQTWTRIEGTGMEPNSVRAAGGITNFTVFSAYLAPPEVDRRPSLGIRDGKIGTTFVDVPEDPFIHGLWVAQDRTIYAAGDDEAGRGFLGIRSPIETWSVFVPSGTCAIHSIHALDPTRVVAAGACDGAAVLWQHDGTDWSELQRFPTIASFAAVRVLGSTAVAAVGPTAVALFDGTAWSIDETVNGNVISGTPNDLWVSGSFTTVQHFDGTSWSRMTTRALQPIHVIVDGRRVLLPGAAPGFAELLR